MVSFEAPRSFVVTVTGYAHSMSTPESSAVSDRSTATVGEVLVPEGDGSAHPLVEASDRRSSFDGQPTVRMPSGAHLPALGLGTWQLVGADLRTVVDEALGIGFRHIDTAQMYGNEADIGTAIEASSIDRNDIFITTKIDNDHHEPGPLVASVQASLERLGTDHVDLLLVHWPVDFERVGATMSALAQVQASGPAHHIGASNFTVEQLDDAAGFAPLEVLQCECHPFLQQIELRNWCVRQDWAFTAHSPLARGDVLVEDTLRELAEKHSVSAASIAVAWLLTQPQTTAVPKTSDVDHLRDNWAALSVELDQLDRDHISVLDEGRRRGAAPMGRRS